MSKVSLLIGQIHNKNSQGIIAHYKTNPEWFNDSIMILLKDKCLNAYKYVKYSGKREELSPKIKFQARVAKKYLSKVDDAIKRGLEFNLTLTSVSNLMKAKKCFFTDLPLNEDTLSFDRVDNSKGYIQGNVVACHTEVNSFKGCMENPSELMNLELVSKMIKRWEERL